MTVNAALALARRVARAAALGLFGFLVLRGDEGDGREEEDDGEEFHRVGGVWYRLSWLSSQDRWLTVGFRVECVFLEDLEESKQALEQDLYTPLTTKKQ